MQKSIKNSSNVNFYRIVQLLDFCIHHVHIGIGFSQKQCEEQHLKRRIFHWKVHTRTGTFLYTFEGARPFAPLDKWDILALLFLAHKVSILPF